MQQWRQKLYNIIFKTDTRAGKNFDIVLLWAIVISILAVVLESVNSINEQFGQVLKAIEWTMTILFTVEYILRIITSPRPRHYIFSFYGIIDFLSIVPTYLAVFLAGSHYLVVLRGLRLLRIFRVFKLSRYIGQGEILKKAVRNSVAKITVFLWVVVSVALIIGALMYVIEGPQSGFTSIPRGLYWAIVTLTTVGYGDIAPQTALGQFLATLVMLLGYGIIAVPTGIMSVEISRAEREDFQKTITCPACGTSGLPMKANYCPNCGKKLPKVS